MNQNLHTFHPSCFICCCLSVYSFVDLGRFNSMFNLTKSGSSPLASVIKHCVFQSFLLKSVISEYSFEISFVCDFMCFACSEKSPDKPVSVLLSDPLALLAKQMGGSKRNALLKWCQKKTANYVVSAKCKIRFI